MATRKIRSTAIRAPTSALENHQIVLSQLKEVAEVGQRLRGDVRDSFVRVAELVEAGIFRVVDQHVLISSALAELLADAPFVKSVVAGTNVTVDSTDPRNPIVSATGGGGSGVVETIVPGDGIDVDDTDPANPIVSNTGVITLTAGDGSVTIDDTDPQNLIIIAPGGGGGTGYPDTLDALVYWFDASTVRLDSGTFVALLQNRGSIYSGLTANALGTGATVSATPLNSERVVTFPGISTGRYVHPIGYLLKNTTVFVVFKPSSLVAGSTFISGAATSFTSLIEATTGKLQIVKTNNALVGTATAGMTVGTWYQANSTYNDTTGAFAFRQAQAANGSGTNIKAIDVVNTVVGYNLAAGVEDMAGDLAELMVYSRVLSGPEIAGVEAYLFAKWGV